MIPAERLGLQGTYGNKTQSEQNSSILLDDIITKISKCITGLVKPIFDYFETRKKDEIRNTKDQIRNCDNRITSNEEIKTHLSGLKYSNIFMETIRKSSIEDRARNLFDLIDEKIKLKNRLKEIGGEGSDDDSDSQSSDGENENRLNVDNTQANQPPDTSHIDSEVYVVWESIDVVPYESDNEETPLPDTGAGVVSDDDNDIPDDIDTLYTLWNQTVTTSSPLSKLEGTGNNNGPQSTGEEIEQFSSGVGNSLVNQQPITTTGNDPDEDEYYDAPDTAEIEKPSIESTLETEDDNKFFDFPEEDGNLQQSNLSTSTNN